MSRWLRWALAGVLVAAGAQAMIAWSSQSTLTTSVVAPPVTFSKGDNADDARWFKSFDLSTNQTSFDATAKPRGGADVTVTDVVRLVEHTGLSRSVSLTASQVTNANVEDFEWIVRNGSTEVGRLDYLATSPSLGFTLPAGGTYTFDLKMDLADGAGRTNAGISFDLTLEVTP